MSDDIKDKIDLIAEESITKISKSKNLNELEDLRIFYLGKKGLKLHRLVKLNQVLHF